MKATNPISKPRWAFVSLLHPYKLIQAKRRRNAMIVQRAPRLTGTVLQEKLLALL
jgi:hypothetical protein